MNLRDWTTCAYWQFCHLGAVVGRDDVVVLECGEDCRAVAAVMPRGAVLEYVRAQGYLDAAAALSAPSATDYQYVVSQSATHTACALARRSPYWRLPLSEVN